MKVCDKCGIEIINGVNGCMLTGNVCFTCRGGAPRYYDKLAAPTYTDEMIDALESRCLDMGESPA